MPTNPTDPTDGSPIQSRKFPKYGRPHIKSSKSLAVQREKAGPTFMPGFGFFFHRNFPRGACVGEIGWGNDQQNHKKLVFNIFNNSVCYIANKCLSIYIANTNKDLYKFQSCHKLVESRELPLKKTTFMAGQQPTSP